MPLKWRKYICTTSYWLFDAHGKCISTPKNTRNILYAWLLYFLHIQRKRAAQAIAFLWHHPCRPENSMAFPNTTEHPQTHHIYIAHFIFSTWKLKCFICTCLNIAVCDIVTLLLTSMKFIWSALSVAFRSKSLVIITICECVFGRARVKTRWGDFRSLFSKYICIYTYIPKLKHEGIFTVRYKVPKVNSVVLVGLVCFIPLCCHWMRQHRQGYYYTFKLRAMEELYRV